MSRTTPESPLFGHSSRLQKQARDVWKSESYRGWVKQYENPSPPPSLEEFPEVNPKAYYRTSRGKLLKGLELAPGPLPINLQETNPSFWEKMEKELTLLVKQYRKFLRRPRGR